MVADVKTANLAIRPALLDAGNAATADLFAATEAPRIAGKPTAQRFTHTCQAASKRLGRSRTCSNRSMEVER